MDQGMREIARAARGFMPEDEGRALYEAATLAARNGPMLEIGSYCGKSAMYLGAAAAERGAVLYSIDHHRGSEEHQRGEGYHDVDVYDERRLRVDTLPEFLRNIEAAGLQRTIVPLVGDSAAIAAAWSAPLTLVFVDGGHSSEAARRDLDGWAPHVASGGFFAIHDVFESPDEGGRAPFEIYTRALRSGSFEESSRCGSLRVLRASSGR